jgi:rhodanese-related sulfurtransferase
MKRLLLLFLFSALSFSCNQKTYDEVELVTPEEMQELMKMENAQLIDIRTPKEYETGFIEGFNNIDFMSETFDADIEKLDKTKPVLLYCRSGRRTAKCSEKLVEKGFVQIYDLKGGITQWKFKGLELKTKP